MPIIKVISNYIYQPLKVTYQIWTSSNYQISMTQFNTGKWKKYPKFRARFIGKKIHYTKPSFIARNLIPNTKQSPTQKNRVTWPNQKERDRVECSLSALLCNNGSHRLSSSSPSLLQTKPSSPNRSPLRQMRLLRLHRGLHRRVHRTRPWALPRPLDMWALRWGRERRGSPIR